jgi:hypothetical protein
MGQHQIPDKSKDTGQKGKRADLGNRFEQGRQVILLRLFRKAAIIE